MERACLSNPDRSASLGRVSIWVRTAYWDLMGWLTNHSRVSAWLRALGALALVLGAQVATGTGGIRWLLPGGQPRSQGA